MDRKEIGVGLVGYKFMGRAHSNAYRQVGRFFDVDPAPRMAVICGRDEAGVSEAAHNLGCNLLPSEPGSTPRAWHFLLPPLGPQPVTPPQPSTSHTPLRWS